MASSNFLFPEGNSIHRPPIFNDEGYHYWKTRMQIFIQAIDYNIWEAIELGPFIPTIVNESTSETNVSALEKPRDQWYEEDRRKIQYNLKAKNIITYEGYLCNIWLLMMFGIGRSFIHFCYSTHNQ